MMSMISLERCGVVCGRCDDNDDDDDEDGPGTLVWLGRYLDLDLDQRSGKPSWHPRDTH